MKDFRLHLPYDTLEWLRTHPEINVSKLAERLVREAHGSGKVTKPRGPVFNVRFTDDTWAAVIRTGRPPANVVRQLVETYIRERRRPCPGNTHH